MRKKKCLRIKVIIRIRVITNSKETLFQDKVNNVFILRNSE